MCFLLQFVKVYFVKMLAENSSNFSFIKVSRYTVTDKSWLLIEFTYAHISLGLCNTCVGAGIKIKSLKASKV